MLGLGSTWERGTFGSHLTVQQGAPIPKLLFEWEPAEGQCST